MFLYILLQSECRMCDARVPTCDQVCASLVTTHANPCSANKPVKSRVDPVLSDIISHVDYRKKTQLNGITLKKKCNKLRNYNFAFERILSCWLQA